VLLSFQQFQSNHSGPKALSFLLDQLPCDRSWYEYHPHYLQGHCYHIATWDLQPIQQFTALPANQSLCLAVQRWYAEKRSFVANIFYLFTFCVLHVPIHRVTQNQDDWTIVLNIPCHPYQSEVGPHTAFGNCVSVVGYRKSSGFSRVGVTVFKSSSFNAFLNAVS
jgi:hypothetical protein